MGSEMCIRDTCSDQELLLPCTEVVEEPGDCDVVRKMYLWWDDGDEEVESEEEGTASLVACLGMSMKSSNIEAPNIAMLAVS